MAEQSKQDANKEKQERKEIEKKIQTADEDSFPASDPPPWTVGRTGAPKRNGNGEEKK